MVGLLETAVWIIGTLHNSDIIVLCLCVPNQVQVMPWSVDLGSRMTFAKLLLPFFILHSVCEGESYIELNRRFEILF